MLNKKIVVDYESSTIKLAWHAGISYETVRVLLYVALLASDMFLVKLCLTVEKNRTNKGCMKI